jgi:hypothetical protein
MVFAGTKFLEFRVSGFGPQLRRVYDLITPPRTPYIREATSNDAKFAPKGGTLLSKIRVVDVTLRAK